MSTAELRKHLIELINKTDEENILNKINRLLEIEAEAKTIYQENEKQIDAINEAPHQYIKGLTRDNDQGQIEGIKQKLVDWIGQLSDSDLIIYLDALRISRTKKDWGIELTLSQQKEIMAGLDDAENGRVVDTNQFWNRLRNA